MSHLDDLAAEYAALTAATPAAFQAWLVEPTVENQRRLAQLHATRRFLAAAALDADQAIDAHILAGLDFDTPDLTCNIALGHWPPFPCSRLADWQIEYTHECTLGLTQRTCDAHWVSAGQRFWDCTRCRRRGMLRDEVMRIAGRM